MEIQPDGVGEIEDLLIDRIMDEQSLYYLNQVFSQDEWDDLDKKFLRVLFDLIM